MFLGWFRQFYIHSESYSLMLTYAHSYSLLSCVRFEIIFWKMDDFYQGFRYMSCVYWPLLTAVFSCLQIVPPMNKMKGAKNEISGKSRKMLQFYWKCMFMIFLAVKSWFHGYFLIKLNINKNLERSFIEIYGGTVDWVRSFVIVFAWCATKKRYEGKQPKVDQNE